MRAAMHPSSPRLHVLEETGHVFSREVHRWEKLSQVDPSPARVMNAQKGADVVLLTS